MVFILSRDNPVEKLSSIERSEVSSSPPSCWGCPTVPLFMGLWLQRPPRVSWPIKLFSASCSCGEFDLIITDWITEGITRRWTIMLCLLLVYLIFSKMSLQEHGLISTVQTKRFLFTIQETVSKWKKGTSLVKYYRCISNRKQQGASSAKDNWNFKLLQCAHSWLTSPAIGQKGALLSLLSFWDSLERTVVLSSDAISVIFCQMNMMLILIMTIKVLL